MKLVVFSSLISLFCNVTSARLSAYNATQHHLAECVEDISRTYFPVGLVLVANNCADESEEWDILLKRLSGVGLWPILEEQRLENNVQLDCRSFPGKVASEECAKIRNQGKAHSYVLMSDAEHIRQQIQQLQTSTTWNSRAAFVVIISSTSRNATQGKEQVRSILGELWQRKVVNVVVISLNVGTRNVKSLPKTSVKSKKVTIVNNTEKIYLYSWFPFHKENQCATQMNKLDILDQWNTQEGTFLLRNNLFPKKLPNNLNGCPVLVSTFHYPPFIVDTSPRHSHGDHGVHFDGLEIQMLRAIADACNLLIHYLPPSPDDVKWGDLLPDGTWFGTMGDIATGRANVTVASLITTKERNFYFDVSQHYLTNAVVWVVPRARFLPRWKSLVKIFSPLFWAILLLTFVLSSTLFYLIGIIPRNYKFRTQNPTGYTTLTTCFTNALAVLLGISISQPSTFFLRLFFLQWAFYCLLVNTAYQSFLISVLTNPGYQKQISSAEELLESDYSIGVTKGYSEFITEISTENRFVLCFGATSCLDHVAYGEEYALVSDEEYARYILPSYVDNADRSRIKILPDKIMSYYVNMMFPKDSLLLERFNGVIERVNEAGLMEKWRREVARFAKRSVNVGKAAGGPIKLSTMHLQGAFAVLIAGVLLSLVVFVVEVIENVVCKYWDRGQSLLCRNLNSKKLDESY